MRLRDLFRRRTLDRQFDSELSFHLERLIEDKIREGLDPAEARRQAVLEFGGTEQVREELRDVHRAQIIETTARNLKAGVRFLRKSPGFSATVILTLAIGIGANSAVMSAIDAILLRPLPFPEADRLVTLHQSSEQRPEMHVAPVRLADWDRMNSTFTAMTGYYTDDATETSGELPEKVTVAYVAPRFLKVWGVSPAAGRDFTREEHHSGGPKSVIVSEHFARSRFGSPEAAIGRTIRLGSSGSTVVGVMPGSFAFPITDVSVWGPVPVDLPLTQNRELTWYRVIGRLRHSTTIEAARADLATVQAQLGKQFPKPDAELRVDVRALKEGTIGGVGRSLWMLYGAASLLLLIACTNVAALLLARTGDRAREVAIRFSLGASRRRVVMQLLTETLVLAGAGSFAGLAVAWAAGRALRSLAASLPRINEVTVDWRVLLYTLVCACVVTIACGLLPALRLTRRSLSEEMTHGGRGQVAAGGRLQWVLVSTQIALSVTLLSGAALMLRTLYELGRTSPGFDADRVLTFHITGSWGETNNPGAVTSRINRTLNALRDTPGVLAAATSVMLPGVDGMPPTELKIVERGEAERKVAAQVRFVSSGYFATMRIPMIAGEACRESREDAVVVNRTFAESYLEGSRAIGYHVRIDGQGMPLPVSGIIGVAGDAREAGIDQSPVATVYWCVSAPMPSPHYLVRTAADPAAMINVIRRRIHEIEPARSVFDVSTLEQRLFETLGEKRLRTILLLFFAFCAVSLSCVGIYGTLNYVASTRRREVGLRLALGAFRGQIVARFLSYGLWCAVIGSVAGLCLTAASSRALAGMLYGVQPSDAATLTGVTCLMLGTAALASLWPSLRAARVEPMDVLRDE